MEILIIVCPSFRHVFFFIKNIFLPYIFIKHDIHSIEIYDHPDISPDISIFHSSPFLWQTFPSEEMKFFKTSDKHKVVARPILDPGSKVSFDWKRSSVGTPVA